MLFPSFTVIAGVIPIPVYVWSSIANMLISLAPISLGSTCNLNLDILSVPACVIVALINEFPTFSMLITHDVSVTLPIVATVSSSLANVGVLPVVLLIIMFTVPPFV